jgi:vacuolar-type H+-ATPase subunit F/Vma7
LYKLVVLTDADNAYGFRLSGVDVFEAETAAEARKKLNTLLNDDTIGIIAVNEDFMVGLDERTTKKIDSIYRPIVIAVPAKKRIVEEEMRREYLTRIIRRAIGFDIRLER